MNIWFQRRRVAKKDQWAKCKQREQPVAVSYRRERHPQTLKHTVTYSFQRTHTRRNLHKESNSDRLAHPTDTKPAARGGSATDDAVVQRRKLEIAASNSSSRDRVHPFNRQAHIEQRDLLSTPPPT
ncbi:hypothetical protein IGI04_039958 [Brassica rapa subsp. trilocularis]|uniref:Homeobox domain-containing protein n=1 Tax=Brassica rapa subsp. trilocularis TaxID=1813537 RepID=A0ABQ7KM66_BRACM|nr:hypothetical protein IGI04_039958 [Brassica rapa subsp. trilocularis]